MTVRCSPAAVAACLVLAVAGPATAVESDCFERPTVVLYLHRLQDRILKNWEMPPDSLLNQRVRIELVIDEQGSLVSYRLLSRTSPRLANTALRALALSAPFEALSEETLCLAGREIVSEFSNPS